MTTLNLQDRTSVWKALAPLCVVVFSEFLAMGLPLPVLGVRVHDTLGFSSFVVGLVLGAQSWATLVTRHASGTRVDAAGPRSAVLRGLVVSVLAGALAMVSAQVPHELTSVTVLVLGRGLLGLGESLVITGALSWGVALAGRERSGLVMAWVGIAMYGALAVGAPLGSSLDARFGFLGVTAVATLAPLLAVAVLPFTRDVAPTGGARLPFSGVAKALWLPGLGLALAALGFGAIAAFATLRFREQGWAHSALAMTAFGGAYVLARLVFGGLPDRFGGARVAAASAATAAVGQLGLWFATSGEVAVASAALTGLGFSLAFPSFGVEAFSACPRRTAASRSGRTRPSSTRRWAWACRRSARWWVRLATRRPSRSAR